MINLLFLLLSLLILVLGVISGLVVLLKQLQGSTQQKIIAVSFINLS